MVLLRRRVPNCLTGVPSSMFIYISALNVTVVYRGGITLSSQFVLPFTNRASRRAYSRKVKEGSFLRAPYSGLLSMDRGLSRCCSTFLCELSIFLLVAPPLFRGMASAWLLVVIWLTSVAAVFVNQVREYNLTLGTKWSSKGQSTGIFEAFKVLTLADGNGRPTYTINGQTPGPLIWGYEGDTLRVRVTNNLIAEATMHW